MKETFRGVVYPAQCDAMGHMNVQYFIAALDQSLWHLMLAIGFSPRWIVERHEGWADVRYEIDFKGELRAGDLFVVEAGIVKLGRTSMTTIHRICEAEGRSIAAEALAVSVYFDLSQRHSKELPVKIREIAMSFLVADG